MENVKIEEKIKTSDDGKGILITNDAIEPVSYTHLTLPTNREV